MRPIKIFITLFLLIAVAFFMNANAQGRRGWNGHTFQFKSKPLVKGDSLHKFYCIIRKTELLEFKNIIINYNKKSKKFLVKDIFKGQSNDYILEGGYVLFNIDEKLDDPFVIVEGEDDTGNRYNIHQRNNNGKVIDPKQEKEKWEKATARIDSMDFVRRFDNVFVGADGKPRYKGKDGHIYIIEKSSTRLDNQ